MDRRKTKKEIHLLRLAVTTRCNLRCKYCFVKKTNKTISYANAIRAVRLLLGSLGREKILIIYGGEPLLCFNLVKKVIIFANVEARLVRKHLIISVGTNGTLLNKGQLRFFRKAGVKLAISADGCKKSHDKARLFKNNRGSFDKLHKNLPAIFKYIEQENVCALFGVLPSSAEKIYDNLVYLNNLGFQNVNIEPVQSRRYQWNKKQEETFSGQLAKYTDYMHKMILKKDYIFLNCINRQLKNARLTTNKRKCPFFQNLEVYPQGEMAFSPFLINSVHKSDYIVGGFKAGFLERYDRCVYDPQNPACMNCWEGYLPDEQHYCDNVNVYVLRNLNSAAYAARIMFLANKQSVFRHYVKEASERIFE